MRNGTPLFAALLGMVLQVASFNHNSIPESRRCRVTKAAAPRSDEVLMRLLEKKKYEVRELEQRHADSFDPVKMRLGYVRYPPSPWSHPNLICE